MSLPADEALLVAGRETGFWDDHGRPGPWPDEFDEWSSALHEPPHSQPGEQPF